MTNAPYLFWPIVIPAVTGLLCLALGRRSSLIGGILVGLATAADLVLAALLFSERSSTTLSLGGFGLSLSLRQDALSAFILLAASGLGFLVALYGARFMHGKRTANVFHGFVLFTLAGVNGAVLSDHLFSLLFFWESLLGSLFGLIVIGHPKAYATAVKALFINGATDLCMMIGIGLTMYLAGTGQIASIHLGTEGLAGLAFLLLVIGATAKAGAMPFHSWIPDAAVDAPLPFMALAPAVMEKLLGIYLLARISLDMFALAPGWASSLLMVLGVVTILLAVLMALVQTDYKRLLSFHAISQVGYMVLGLGTALPVGIVGGLFHMVNHAMYKSTLFLTGGAVERQAGTTDLKRLGGLAKAMPLTFGCFVVAALAISGVPPLNGFFSKELVYDAALLRHPLLYVGAVLGSFFTAASFLKLGHAAFRGAPRAPVAEVKEAPGLMLVPMITIAALCILFGVYNPLPLGGLVEPAVAAHLHGETFAGLPHTWGLVAATVVVIALAVGHHIWGAKRAGSGLGAVDHIHHAPGIRTLYDAAEARRFDPYEIALKGIRGIARVAYVIDRAIDGLYEKVVGGLVRAFSFLLRAAHTGSPTMYLAWAIAGAFTVVWILVRGF